MSMLEGPLSPMTAFVLLVSAARSLKPPALYDVVQRREKNDADSTVAGKPPDQKIKTRDFNIPGPGGILPLRLYEQAEGGTDALILYYHGGGWVLGNLASHSSVARGLCRHSGAKVLALDYRLAPEHPFPAAPEDALTAYEWTLDQAEHLGVSKSRIFVAGDSAGGGLAASLCLIAKKKGLPQPAGQLLLFPVTDISRTDRESYHRFANGFLLTKADMEWFISLYCKEEDRHDPRASPFLAKDLSGLAPALVITAQFDVLRDEGEAYAARLAESGVHVQHRRYRGTIHCFTSMERFIPAAAKAFRLVSSFVNGVTSRK